MGVLARYLLSRAALTLLLCLALFAGTLWLLQALRLGHHVIGAHLGPTFVAGLLRDSLPTLLTFALPPALAAALLFTLGRLATSQELLAMQIAGASPLRLALPCALLAVLSAAASWLFAVELEPGALTRLQRALQHGAARALVLGIQPGRFHRLVGETTLYVEERLPSPGDHQACFAGVLLEQQDASLVLIARRATLSLAPEQTTTLIFALEEGELQSHNASGGLRRVRFRHLQRELELDAALDRHFRFLGAQAHAWRSLTAPAACLALGLLATALGLSRYRSWYLALLGLLSLAAFEGGSLALEALWPGPGARLGLCAGVVVLSLALLARASGLLRRRG